MTIGSILRNCDLKSQESRGIIVWFMIAKKREETTVTVTDADACSVSRNLVIATFGNILIFRLGLS